MAFKTADLIILCRNCLDTEQNPEDEPDPSRNLVPIRPFSRPRTTRFWKRSAVGPSVASGYDALHSVVEAVEGQDPDLQAYGPYDGDPESLTELRQILQDALDEVDAQISSQS